MEAYDQAKINRGVTHMVLRKVTANLRSLVESKLEGTDKEVFEEDLERYGVIEAEALLKRIDES
jgi:hypothetical protein